jgi:hypothetical protein
MPKSARAFLPRGRMDKNRLDRSPTRPRCCRNTSPLLAAQGWGAAHCGCSITQPRKRAAAYGRLFPDSFPTTNLACRSTAGVHGRWRTHSAGGAVSKNSRERAAAFSGSVASKTRGHHVMVATNGPGRAVSETTGPPGPPPEGEESGALLGRRAPMRVTKFCP